MSPRPRVLVVGQAVHPTGYARVLGSLFEHLAARYEIHQLGLNYRGPRVEGAWTVHPNALRGDTHGTRQIAGLIESLRPELVWFLHDLYIYPLHEPHLAPYRDRLSVVLYCPIDGTQPRPDVLRRAASVDRLVLFAPFAHASVEGAFAELARREPGFSAPPLAVVPHGVDPHRFHRLGSPAEPDAHRRARARAALFPDRPELRDAFLVLNANRNSLRKRVDLTLRAFADFARDKPRDVYLYLHMGMCDRGYDVPRLARELGITDRLLVSTSEDERPHLSDERLNLVYNACDVGLNTATGEGWGLVAFEHGATGAAQVMPAHSACRALWEGAALLFDPGPVVHNPRDFVLHHAPEPRAVAAALEQLYRDRALREELSSRALQRALAPELAWAPIAAQWDALLRDVLAERARRPS